MRKYLFGHQEMTKFGPKTIISLLAIWKHLKIHGIALCETLMHSKTDSSFHILDNYNHQIVRVWTQRVQTLLFCFCSSVGNPGIGMTHQEGLQSLTKLNHLREIKSFNNVNVYVLYVSLNNY